MKNKTKTLFLCILLLLWIGLVGNQCGLLKSSRDQHDFARDGVLRLMDRLEAVNIRATPLAGLINNFRQLEENLQGKLALLGELSTSQQKVWCFTTQTSILGPNETIAPQKMEITLNSQKIPFLNGQNSSTVQWKWVETSKNIDIKYDPNYNRGFKCLVLDEKETFTFEAIFPDSPVVVEVYGRRNWHPVDVEIYLDGEFQDKASVGRNFGRFRFGVNVPPGTHRIDIKPALTERLKSKNPTPPRLLVYQTRILAQNDMILFFVPNSLQQEFSQGRLAAQYLSDLDADGNLNPYTYLYKLKHAFTLDEFEQKINPENIKKRLVLEDLSLNAMIAPPESRYEFEMDLASGCFLEFGAGIFAFSQNMEAQAAKFKILAHVAEKEEEVHTLFEEEIGLQPEPLRDQISRKKIDLSRFADKKIRLSLITEPVSPSPSHSLSPLNLPFAFWSNPIIYQSQKPETQQQLKVILVSLDTLRADHLGCYGYERPTSPNIDILAQDSVLFENTYAQSPWTLPSHISILYALNSASHQVYFNDQGIDGSLPSLASFLKEKGYITHAFTGGGYVSSIFGFTKGFDAYDEPEGGRKAPLVNNEAEKLYEYTSEWLGRNKDKPFFLFLHTFQTHGPYDCPAPWNEFFLKPEHLWKKLPLRNFLIKNGEDYNFSQQEHENIVALYDGEIRYTDETLIKPLVTRLKELDIYDDTLLIIISDHGEEFLDHGGWLHGGTLYEELIRVPMLIKFPQSQFKNTRVQATSRLIDILPTVLEIAGVSYPQKKIDGKSLLPLLNGKEKEDRIFISDLARKEISIPCPSMMATNYNHRAGIKFIFTKSKDGVKNIETFDLNRDPQEKENLSAENQPLYERALRFLDDYYNRKMKIRRKQETVHIDKELEQKLKALGYLK